MCVKRPSTRSILNHPDLIPRLDPRALHQKYVVLMTEHDRVLFHQAGESQIWEAELHELMGDPEFTSNLSRPDLEWLACVAANLMNPRPPYKTSETSAKTPI